MPPPAPPPAPPPFTCTSATPRAATRSTPTSTARRSPPCAAQSAPDLVIQITTEAVGRYTPGRADGDACARSGPRRCRSRSANSSPTRPPRRRPAASSHWMAESRVAPQFILYAPEEVTRLPRPHRPRRYPLRRGRSCSSSSAATPPTSSRSPADLDPFVAALGGRDLPWAMLRLRPARSRMRPPRGPARRPRPRRLREQPPSPRRCPRAEQRRAGQGHRRPPPRGGISASWMRPGRAHSWASARNRIFRRAWRVAEGAAGRYTSRDRDETGGGPCL